VRDIDEMCNGNKLHSATKEIGNSTKCEESIDVEIGE
jgi:hypothetical protein